MSCYPVCYATRQWVVVDQIHAWNRTNHRPSYGRVITPWRTFLYLHHVWPVHTGVQLLTPCLTCERTPFEIASLLTFPDLTYFAAQRVASFTAKTSIPSTCTQKINSRAVTWCSLHNSPQLHIQNVLVSQYLVFTDFKGGKKWFELRALYMPARMV